jgi:hypothetical protein
MNMQEFNENKITLFQIVKYAKEGLLYARRYKFLIFIILFISIGVAFYLSIIDKPIFTAKLTFAVEEEKANVGLSGALGLASSLGLDVGNSNSGIFSGPNLLELFKSRSVIEKTLMKESQSIGLYRTLGDYMINMVGLKEKWPKDEFYKNFSFAKQYPIDDFNSIRRKDSLLSLLYNIITTSKGGMLSVYQKDRKISIITIEFSCEDELFAKNFTESVTSVVSDFYIETKSKKARLNYEILKFQTDSIRNELNLSIAGVATANDNAFNLNSAYNIKRVPSAKKQIDVQANTAILTQLVTSLEMSKVALRKETPLIQIIDKPILPLHFERLGRIKATFLGGVIGSLIAIFILLLIKFKESLKRYNKSE